MLLLLCVGAVTVVAKDKKDKGDGESEYSYSYTYSDEAAGGEGGDKAADGEEEGSYYSYSGYYT
jgi:hypothetical protein